MLLIFVLLFQLVTCFVSLFYYLRKKEKEKKRSIFRQPVLLLNKEEEKKKRSNEDGNIIGTRSCFSIAPRHLLRCEEIRDTAVVVFPITWCIDIKK